MPQAFKGVTVTTKLSGGPVVTPAPEANVQYIIGHFGQFYRQHLDSG